MIWEGAGEPDPYEICDPVTYLTLNITFNVILFTCSHGLNPFQLVVLQYCLQNWSKILQAKNPMSILNKKRFNVYNPHPVLKARLVKFRQ